MFSAEWSIIIGSVCAVLAVIFFMGKGAGIISAFEGKNAPKKKKKSPEDERRYQRAFGIFCVIIGGMEFLSLALPQSTAIGIIYIVAVVGALIWVTVYLKKNFPDG